MKLGVSLPLTDIGADPVTIRDFAQQAEELGYKHLAAADHVLGVNAKNRPHWGDRNTSQDCFHDPFVLFGFLAAHTKKIELTTEVLVLPQRQTALVAKQAACLDVLSGGRLRLGVGVGWNAEEFVALSENFKNRGVRSAEQVQVLTALWADPHVTYSGRWHKIEDLGINPLPFKRSIPLWFGGHEKVTLQRIAKVGDGWIMIAWPPNDEALTQIETLREYVREEGRKLDDVGIEVWVSASGSPDEWRRELEFWHEAGVTHVCLNNTFSRYQHKRIKEHTVGAHLETISKYMNIVADLVA